MNENRSATLQELLQYALPFGSSLVIGSEQVAVKWAVTVRVLDVNHTDLDAHDLALVALDLLRALDDRLTLADAIRYLAQEFGVRALATPNVIDAAALMTAQELDVSLLLLPQDAGFLKVERAVNTLMVQQQVQHMNRAVEIQRQLSRLSAENRDLNSLLRLLADTLTHTIAVHDEAGHLIAQEHSRTLRRVLGRGGQMSEFENWLRAGVPDQEGVVMSAVGGTVLLKVEKRVAGYLTLLKPHAPLDDFERLVLVSGADVCAIELAKMRAINAAVEQTRGDWVQMWLTGSPADDAQLMTRAQQAGFDPHSTYFTVAFKVFGKPGGNVPYESFLAMVRDEMGRRQINGALGVHIDAVVLLIAVDSAYLLERMRDHLEQIRLHLTERIPQAKVGAGVSQMAQGLGALRAAYREARGAVEMAAQIGTVGTTFYADLKLFRLLIALKDKENALDQLKRFHQETLGALLDYDARRQADLLKTLDGFFAANGNLAKAAVDLNVHRNTLVYRLERITDLTGMNLDDPDNRLILHLALKIGRILPAG